MRRTHLPGILLLLVLILPPTNAFLQLSVSSAPKQCNPILVTVNGGTPPFDFIVLLPTEGHIVAHRETFASTSNPFATWEGSVPAGKSVSFEVEDANRAHGVSLSFIVQGSDDDSCLGGSQPQDPSPTTSSPSFAVTTTTSITTFPQTSFPTSTPIPPDGPRQGDSSAPPGPQTTSVTTVASPPASRSRDSGSIATSSSSLVFGSDASTASSFTKGEAGVTDTSQLTSVSNNTDTAGSTASSSGLLPTPTTQSPITPGGHATNLGLIIGLAVAALVVIVIILGVLYRRRRRRATRRSEIVQFEAHDVEGSGRPHSSDHSVLLSDLSPKAAICQHIPSSSVRSSLRQNALSFTESSTVLYLHPHAPESVVTQPTASDVFVAPPPTHTQTSSELFPCHDQKSSISSITDAEKTTTGAHTPETLPDILRGQPIHNPESNPNDRSRAAPRVTSAGSCHSQPQSEGFGAGVNGEIVYELDGGVCLAGGPPGGTRADPRHAPGVALTLPPPYQLYFTDS